MEKWWIMLDAKLETLLVVAEKKSFTKASVILSLTQPAVSKHISLLEEELLQMFWQMMIFH